MRNKPKLLFSLVVLILIAVPILIIFGKKTATYDLAEVYEYTPGSEMIVNLDLDKNKPISIISSPYYNLTSSYSGKKLAIKLFSRTTPGELGQIDIKNGDTELTLYYRTNDTSNYQQFVEKLPNSNNKIRITETGNYKFSVKPYNLPMTDSEFQSELKKIFQKNNLDYRSFVIITESVNQMEEKNLDNKVFKDGEFLEGGNENSH